MTFEATADKSHVRMGPAELLIDVPFHMGCYKTLQNSLQVVITEIYPLDNSPVKCLTHCLENGLRYAGLQGGATCACFSDLPRSELYNVNSADCDEQCPGGLETCGGQGDTWDFYVTSKDKCQGIFVSSVKSLRCSLP